MIRGVQACIAPEQAKLFQIQHTIRRMQACIAPEQINLCGIQDTIRRMQVCIAPEQTTSVEFKTRSGACKFGSPRSKQALQNSRYDPAYASLHFHGANKTCGKSKHDSAHASLHCSRAN